MDHRLFILAAALVLDRIVGDPRWLWGWLPHPVVLAGRAVAALELRLNRAGESFTKRRRAGVLATAILIAGSLGLGWLLEAAASRLPAGWLAEMVVVSVFLAQKSLLDHVAAVSSALRKEGLLAGRREVAKIVGRDVNALDRSGVCRAAIESLAENFSDGTVAPLFWYVLLGLPGLLLFKVVNTADSMIGHRSERYEAFGWAAARLDDLMNLVPARLSALAIAAGAAASGHAWREALGVAWRDAGKHKSPNAGWPEAALAGALDVALGGPRLYGGDYLDGAWLNPAAPPVLSPTKIRAALGLIEWSWAVLLATVVISAIALAL